MAIMPIRAQLYGTYGDNLTWKLDTVPDESSPNILHFKLTLFGYGPTYDFCSGNIGRGFTFHHLANTDSIGLPEGLTCIGCNSFYNFYSVKSLRVPSTVTRISNYAFWNTTALCNLLLPEGLTYIGDYAFESGYALSELNLPSTIDTLGSLAFANIAMLSRVSCPSPPPPVISSNTFNKEYGDSITVYVPFEAISTYQADALWSRFPITYIRQDEYTGTCGDDLTWRFVTADSTLYIYGSGAMTYEGTAPWALLMSGIRAVSLPEGLTTIGNGAFNGCTSLTTIAFPTSLTAIGDNAFHGCIRLSDAVLPASLTAIGNGAFSGCNALDIVIPAGVESIGAASFRSTHGSTLTIPNSVTSLGDSLCYECGNLTSVNIGSGVTAIPGYAFYNCEALHSISMPETVTSIGQCAFYRCLTLNSINWPATLQRINDYAFYACQAMPSPQLYEGLTHLGLGAFAICISITEVDLPESLTAIGNGAFGTCHALHRVSIGSGITSLPQQSFMGCNALDTIVCHAPEPPTLGSTAFYNTTPANIHLFVPLAGYTAYETADTWSDMILDFIHGVDADGTHNGFTWHYDHTAGTLRIDGSGALPAHFDAAAPWHPVNDSIKIGRAHV